MPTFSLADADCRALATAQVLGVAVVVSSVPDCSGIGHARIVLEVQQLARGAAIQTVVTSRPLHGVDEGPRFREGDTVVISIAAAKEPARTVSCVPLPASDGTVSHAVSVEDTDEGRRMLAAIVDGRCYASP